MCLCVCCLRQKELRLGLELGDKVTLSCNAGRMPHCKPKSKTETLQCSASALTFSALPFSYFTNLGSGLRFPANLVLLAPADVLNKDWPSIE